MASLALVGRYFKSRASIPLQTPRHPVSLSQRAATQHVDPQLCRLDRQSKSDLDAIEDFRGDRFFKGKRWVWWVCRPRPHCARAWTHGAACQCRVVLRALRQWHLDSGLAGRSVFSDQPDGDPEVEKHARDCPRTHLTLRGVEGMPRGEPARKRADFVPDQFLPCAVTSPYR